MFAILLNEKGGEQRRLEFDKSEVAIGRVPGNDIILAKSNVSKRHSRIVLKDGKFIVIDLKSTNGTYVNGRKVLSPLVVKGADKIYIGDFVLSIEDKQSSVEERAIRRPSTIPPPPPRIPDVGTDSHELSPAEVLEDRGLDEQEAKPQLASRPPPAPPPSSSSAVRPGTTGTVAGVVAPRPPFSSSPHLAVAPASSDQRSILVPRSSSAAPPNVPTLDSGDGDQALGALRILIERLTVALRLPVDPHAIDEDLLARAERTASTLLNELSDEGLLPPNLDFTAIARDAAMEVVGAGPLDELIADESVERVLVTRPDQIYVSRDGRWQLHRKIFSSAEAVERAIGRLLFRSGARGIEPTGMGDPDTREGTLPNGVHLTVAVRSIASRGGALSLRRLTQGQMSLSDLIARGSLSDKMATLLESVVRGRHNLIVSGSTGAGRSALLSSLLGALRSAEVVLVEQGHSVPIGKGPVTVLRSDGGDVRRVLAAAARFGAEYLVFADVLGSEALDLLGAMVSGSTGVICSLSASSPREALSRLCALSRLAADAPAARVLAQEWARAAKCVVQVAQRSGQLVVTEITEVLPEEAGFDLRTLFSSRAGEFEAGSEIPDWANGPSGGA
jgi:pilus assembly protein CpaF